MTRDEALKRLRALKTDLQGRGVTSLYLFGSTARDEADDRSDIDLAFEAYGNPDFSILHQELIRLEIEARLGVSVDLIGRKSLRRRTTRAEADLVKIF